MLMRKYGVAALVGSVFLMTASGAVAQTNIASASNPRAESAAYVFLDKGSGQLSSTAVDIVRNAATATRSARKVWLVGYPDDVNVVRAELLRQGVAAESIMVLRETGQPPQKTSDGISEPIDRSVEIKF
jgi:hypothetical protein